MTVCMRFIAITLMVFQLGCTPLMITFRPSAKDLSVLDPERPRADLVDEFGLPPSALDARECCEDILFDPGYSAGRKAVLIPLTLFLDVFTLGLAEMQLLEVETARGRSRVGILVRYDQEQRVETACLYQGADALLWSTSTTLPECDVSMIEFRRCTVAAGR